jgi:hypothetical protein
MRFNLTFLIAIVLGSLQTNAQNYSSADPAYAENVEKGLAALEAGNCMECIDFYKKAFAITTKSSLSLTRAAACAYSCDDHDLANEWLDLAIENDWNSSQNFILRNSEFKPYRETSLMEVIRLKTDAQMDKLGLDKDLIAELENIRTEDQQFRQQLNDASEEERKILWEKIEYYDSINLIKIEKIIEQHGYPGKSLVGDGVSNVAWLVIQHSPLEVQEKYLPMMQEAAAKGEMSKSNLALLIDRIRMRNGENQIYGSQISKDPEDGQMHLYPVEDLENLNQKRAEVGLGPIEDYLTHFNLNWEDEKAWISRKKEDK